MSKVCKGCTELKNMKTAQLKIDERSELAYLKRYSNVQKIYKNAMIQEVKLELRGDTFSNSLEWKVEDGRY